MNRTISEQKNTSQHENEPKGMEPDEIGINDFGEIIRTGESSEEFVISDDIPIFQPPTNEQPINDSNLSFKQRIALFLQRNSFLINIPFIEKFVNKQMNILPAPGKNILKVNASKEKFDAWVTGNGEYSKLLNTPKNLSPERNGTKAKTKPSERTPNDDLTL